MIQSPEAQAMLATQRMLMASQFTPDNKEMFIGALWAANFIDEFMSQLSTFDGLNEAEHYSLVANALAVLVSQIYRHSIFLEISPEDVPEGDPDIYAAMENLFKDYLTNYLDEN